MQRTALVVGAAGGVGGEVVRQLLDKGYRVIATVLNQTEAASVAPGVEKTIFLDLSNADKVVPTLQQQGIAALDAVVVCAAISPYGPLESAPLEVLRRTLEINTVSHVAIYQACVPLLRASKGRLLFISSHSGRVALPFLGHYAASKFALEGIADAMRREARVFGVDVILVEPGGIKTPLVVAQVDNIASERAKLSPAHAALYSGYYDNFAGLVKKSWDGMLEPAVVAQTVVEALQAESPLARYPVGEDAKFLCNIAAHKPDAELDAIVAAFARA